MSNFGINLNYLKGFFKNIKKYLDFLYYVKNKKILINDFDIKLVNDNLIFSKKDSVNSEKILNALLKESIDNKQSNFPIVENVDEKFNNISQKSSDNKNTNEHKMKYVIMDAIKEENDINIKKCN